MAKRTKQRPLTAKQEKFCQEYMIDLNATQAAVRAGYAAHSVSAFGTIGVANLQKVAIKAEIQRVRAKRSEKTGIKAEDVVLELAKVAFSNIEDFAKITKRNVTFTEFKKLAREQLAAVESIGSTKEGKITLKLHSKLNALEQLGRHFGINEADNAQKGDKTINIINFNNIDDTQQIISGPAGPARITGPKSV